MAVYFHRFMSARREIVRSFRMAALSASVALFLLVPVFCAPDAESPVAAPAPPGVGDQVVTFPAPDLQGKDVDVGTLIAGKTALITFWASWCQPCMEEVPRLRSLYSEYRGSEFVVVGIGVSQGGDDAKKQIGAAKRQTMDYPLVYDAQEAYQKAYALSSVPLNLLVDRAGIVRFKGPVLPEDIANRIGELVTAPVAADPGGE